MDKNMPDKYLSYQVVFVVSFFFKLLSFTTFMNNPFFQCLTLMPQTSGILTKYGYDIRTTYTTLHPYTSTHTRHVSNRTRVLSNETIPDQFSQKILGI